MANIDVKYTQQVVDQNHAFDLTSSEDGSLSSLLDTVISLDYLINTNYYRFTSWSLVGNTLRVSFSNGASTIYTGTVSDPNAYSGTASVSNISFNIPNVLMASESGSLNYNWSVTPSGYLSFNTTGGNISAVSIVTKYPTTSPYYDSVLGNTTIRLNGNIYYDSNGNLSGTVNSITVSSEKFAKSAVIDGTFNVSGNSLSIGQNLTDSNVFGNMTSYAEDYYDGSYLRVNNLGAGGLYLANKQTIDVDLLGNPDNFTGDDTISLDLPSTLYEKWIIASGTGNDVISIKGGGSNLAVNAGSGNDTISILDRGHAVDGGTGLDTVIYSSKMSSVTVAQVSSVVSIKDSSGTDSISNVERIKFSDYNVAFDANGANSAGGIYRLYQAAFDRKPDLPGLGYWINAADNGKSAVAMAEDFTWSKEFLTLFQLSTPQDNYFTGVNVKTLVEGMYQHVLHRTPDAGGLNYYVGVIQSHEKTVGRVLAEISDSPENYIAVAGQITDGIQYTPWL